MHPVDIYLEVFYKFPEHCMVLSAISDLIGGPDRSNNVKLGRLFSMNCQFSILLGQIGYPILSETYINNYQEQFEPRYSLLNHF